MDKNIEEFQHLLKKENWDEVSASNESNTSFNIFLDTFSYYFTTMFDCKYPHSQQLDAHKILIVINCKPAMKCRHLKI